MTSDDIGQRGQWLFCLLLTDLCGRDAPYFRPRFLGDKFPTFDYIVELVDYPGDYFFVQVKATTQGFTEEPARLKVQVSQSDVDRMVGFSAPTYVVGIDATSRTPLGFVVSVNEPRPAITSLPTAFRIDCDLLRDLQDEVRAYWASRQMMLTSSRFRE